MHVPLVLCATLPLIYSFIASILFLKSGNAALIERQTEQCRCTELMLMDIYGCCCPFYVPQLYRQVLLRRVLAMGILSVCLSVRLSVTARCRNNRVT